MQAALQYAGCAATAIDALPASPSAVVAPNVTELHVFGYSPSQWRRLTLVDTTTGATVALGPPLLEDGYEDPGLARVALGEALIPDHAYELTADTGLLALSLTAFTVSPLLDRAPPVGPRVDGLVSTCGAPRTSVPGTLSWPGSHEDELLVVRFVADDGAVVERLLRSEPDALQHLGTDPCRVSLPLAVGATYQVEIAARDLAGNESPPVTRSITVHDCSPGPIEPMDPDDDPDADTGGCATYPTASGLPGLAAVGLLAVTRRRRPAPRG